MPFGIAAVSPLLAYISGISRTASSIPGRGSHMPSPPFVRGECLPACSCFLCLKRKNINKHTFLPRLACLFAWQARLRDMPDISSTPTTCYSQKPFCLFLETGRKLYGQPACHALLLVDISHYIYNILPISSGTAARMLPKKAVSPPACPTSGKPSGIQVDPSSLCTCLAAGQAEKAVFVELEN